MDPFQPKGSNPSMLKHLRVCLFSSVLATAKSDPDLCVRFEDSDGFCILPMCFLFLRFHLAPVRMVLSRTYIYMHAYRYTDTQTHTHTNDNKAEIERFYTVGGNVNQYRHFGKIPFNPTLLFLNIFQKDLNIL